MCSEVARKLEIGGILERNNAHKGIDQGQVYLLIQSIDIAKIGMSWHPAAGSTKALDPSCK